MPSLTEDKAPSVYSLTELTGKKSSGNRRVIIQGFDIQWRVFMICAFGFLPAVIITAIFWIFLGQMSLLAIPVFYAVVFWMIEGRSRDGLKLRRYQAMRDKRKAVTGQFYLCGRRIDPINPLRTTLRQSSVPTGRDRSGYSLIDDLYEGSHPAVVDPYSVHEKAPSPNDALRQQRAKRAEEDRAARRARYERAQAKRAEQKKRAADERAAAAARRAASGRPAYHHLSADELASAADPFAN